MGKPLKTQIVLEDMIVSKIFLIRNKKVMLDIDLSEMYAVETKQLKRQVKRNINRFPTDFMFVLTRKEFENLRSQIGTSSWGGTRYMPMAFTEQGVAMLSSVLSSKTAIEVNIQIIRVFNRMRELLLTQKNVLLRLERMEKQMIKQDGKMKGYEEEIQKIFDALKRLLHPLQVPRERIGFKRANEK